MEDAWKGKKVLLKQDIRNSNEPPGLQVYVRAGTLGEIVGLARDVDAPFRVKFPGFKYKVVVKLEDLDLNPGTSLYEDCSMA